MSNIIFLDIDGVLVTKESWDRPPVLVPGEELNGRKMRVRQAGPRCKSALEWLLEATAADIVISSVWGGYGIIRMRKIFKAWGLPGSRIIGLTPARHTRSEEIQAWLDDNQHGSYVVIDDDPLDLYNPSCPASGHEGHYVRTDFDDGLTQLLAAKAARILGRTRQVLAGSEA